MTWNHNTNITVSINSDSTGSFYTGDIVTGTVVLELEKQRKLESIDLEVVGTCKAQWTRSAPTLPYIQIYSGKKKVYYVKMDNIFGYVSVGGKLRPGVYSYPFHFALPQDLPSTFRDSTASVEYLLKITSKQPCRITKTVPLRVLGSLNLNDSEEMLTPCVYEFKRRFERSNSEVTINIKTYKGMAARQNLPFKVIVTNEKKVSISKLKLTLVQKLRYSVSSGFLDDERKIIKKEYKHFSKNITTICNIDMEIPQINPSSLYMTDPDPMVNTSYEIQVELVFPFHFNLRESFPVTIASIPVLHYDL